MQVAVQKFRSKFKQFEISIEGYNEAIGFYDTLKKMKIILQDRMDSIIPVKLSPRRTQSNLVKLKIIDGLEELLISKADPLVPMSVRFENIASFLNQGNNQTLLSEDDDATFQQLLNAFPRKVVKSPRSEKGQYQTAFFVKKQDQSTEEGLQPKPNKGGIDPSKK